ncbi:MAG: YqiA/YcfP family alpha/beta fold hydrolase [Lautropia sp.]
MRLIYLHGFRSSARSFKAQLLAARMQALGHGEQYFAPDLAVEPAHAIGDVLERLAPTAADTLVGSSLGGCYATWLAEQTGCRAVLLNPAVRPARDLASRVGPQTGYHDGVPFEFKAEYVEQLRGYQVDAITRPERYYLIAAKGDEVLDWREMVAHYPGARQTVLPGSDHGLSDFATLQDSVIAFAGFASGER